MTELTKDADKMLCCLYKEYLQRIKSGSSKSSSKFFNMEYTDTDSILSQWHNDDVCTVRNELNGKGLLKTYTSGNFELTDNAVLYMENRFKAGLSEVLKYLADLATDIAVSLI